MPISDFLRETEQKKKATLSSVISTYKQSGKLGETVRLYETEPIEPSPIVKTESFWDRTKKSGEALAKGDITFSDVMKQVPKNIKKTGVGIAETIAPSLTKFVDTSFSVFGEGLAYAFDKNLREQVKSGNYELPTISQMTPAKMVKYTIAAGLETAVFRSFPNVVKMNLMQRGGAGALQGVGFAVAEGMAKDKTPEEVMASLPEYGVGGAVLNVIAPYLLPVLKAELNNFPKDLKGIFKSVDSTIAQDTATKLQINSLQMDSTRVPISTPNTRYQAYLRSQGYEPYVPESKLPVIEAGEVPPPKPSNLPEVKPGEAPPRVYDVNEAQARAAGYEPYTPEGELPTIQAGGRVKTKDVPYTEMVPEPVPRQTPTPVATKTAPKASPIKTEPAPTAVVEPTTPPPEGARVTRIPGENLPVGEGKTQISRLEARMKQTLDEVNPQRAKEAGIETYSQMNKREQIAKAAQYVEKNTVDDVLKILRGEKAAPSGLLNNSLALALEKKISGTADANLAVKLASLRSTRAGQEISILTEADPTNVVNQISEIIQARTTRVARRNKGTTPAKLTAATAKEAKAAAATAQLKIEEAESLLNDILC